MYAFVLGKKWVLSATYSTVKNKKEKYRKINEGGWIIA